MSLIRKCFEKNHFIEVETPILVSCPDLSCNLNILETEIHSSPLEPSSQRHSSPPPFAKGGGEESRGARNGLSNAYFATESFIPQSGTQDDAMVFKQPVEREKGGVITSLKSPITQKKYLITSPEFSMKKLLALSTQTPYCDSELNFKFPLLKKERRGEDSNNLAQFREDEVSKNAKQQINPFDNIYTITKVFRDKEENTGIHSIEFTLLEWYRKNADYNDIMRDTEELVWLLFKHGKNPLFAKKKLGRLSKKSFLRHSEPRYEAKNPLVKRTGHGISFPLSGIVQNDDFRQPIGEVSRLKVSNLFKKYAKIENVEKLTLPVFTKIVHSQGYSRDKNLTYEQCFNLIFLNEVEPKLPKSPFFLIDYPAPLACLAKLKKNNPLIAERFELYINGIELCNGFSELTDGKEQLSRFKKENKERKKMGKPELPIDYELCEKLDLINCPVGGNALGVDRLIMLLLSADTIDEVMY